MSGFYRYKIIIEYDGSRFHGWQRQSHPLTGELVTVQGALEIAVFKLTKKEVLVDFILEKLNSGKTLSEIEKLLENGLSEKVYSFSDILESVNIALKEKLTSTKEEILLSKKEKDLDLNDDSPNLHRRVLFMMLGKIATVGRPKAPELLNKIYRSDDVGNLEKYY
jgi:DNA-binding transcriptional MerR regulator